MPSGERFGAAEISPGLMPRLGLGTPKIRGEDATRSTLDALRSGCRHIDTASCYRNEEEVRLGINIWRSEAAADVDGREGNEANDDDVFITSKLAPNEMGETRVHAALDGVYERLDAGFRSSPGEPRVPPLDLALVHWPGMARTPPDSPANRTARAETWRALEDALASRAVRAIGVSNYTRTHLLEMRDYARVFPAVNQVEFHPRCQQRELRQTARRSASGSWRTPRWDAASCSKTLGCRERRSYWRRRAVTASDAGASHLSGAGRPGSSRPIGPANRRSRAPQRGPRGVRARRRWRRRAAQLSTPRSASWTAWTTGRTSVGTRPPLDEPRFGRDDWRR